jgi:hypothetical protein
VTEPKARIVNIAIIDRGVRRNAAQFIRQLTEQEPALSLNARILAKLHMFILYSFTCQAYGAKTPN